MATNNAINSNNPIGVSDGGVGAATLTDHAVLVGSGINAITALTVGSTGELLIGATSSDPVFGSSAAANFSFTSATASTNRVLTISNTDNTVAATSEATLIHSVGGASGGDPKTTFTVTGGTTYTQGVDNTDSDMFKISIGTALGTNDAFTITTSGAIRLPLTVFSHAHNGTLKSNIGFGTGAYTGVNVTMDSEDYDQQSNYSTGTGKFTAPQTGVYFFTIGSKLADVTSGQTYINLSTNGATTFGPFFTYDCDGSVLSTSGDLTFGASMLYYLTAADTIEMAYADTLGVLTTDVPVSTSTYFSAKIIA